MSLFKRSGSGFAIIIVYIDDFIIRTPEELTNIVAYVKKEFEMKDSRKTKFCLGLHVEHLPNEIFIHQSTYIEKVLNQFYIDKACPFEYSYDSAIS